MKGRFAICIAIPIVGGRKQKKVEVYDMQVGMKWSFIDEKVKRFPTVPLQAQSRALQKKKRKTIIIQM